MDELMDLLFAEFNTEITEVRPSNKKEELKCVCSAIYINDGIQMCSKCGSIRLNSDDISTEESEMFVCSSIVSNSIEKASLGTNICGSSYLSRINSWGIWLNNYKEKTFLDLIDIIKEFCQDKIPKIIIDNSIACIKEINNAKHKSGKNLGQFVIIRGINKKSLIAASVYYSSKMTNYPLTTLEVSRLFQIKMKELTKGEKLFDKIVPVYLKSKMAGNNKSEVLLFVKRYTKAINLCELGTKKSLDICSNLISIEQSLINGTPSLQAIACIYLGIQFLDIKSISKKDLQESVHIYSDTILNKMYKSIMKYKNILCDDDITKEWIKTSNEIRDSICN